MLYKKITFIAASIYAFLSMPTYGSLYYVSSVGIKRASHNPYTCPPVDNCVIHCDVGDHKEELEFHCGSSGKCIFYCEEKKCGNKATIYGENAGSLLVYGEAKECLKDSNVYVPNSGSAYFYNGNTAEKPYKGMDIYSGPNTQEIVLNCDGTSTGDECKNTNVYASSAQFLQINVGYLKELQEVTIECPADSSYHGSQIAPCIIDAKTGYLYDVTIRAPWGTPKGLYITGASQYSNVWLECNEGHRSEYPFTLSDDCWWTNNPTTDPTTAPTNTPTQPTTNPTAAPTSPPTKSPTDAPTLAPTLAPTVAPTKAPSYAPTLSPSVAPTYPPSRSPSDAPTKAPSLAPTLAPTKAPSDVPTSSPSRGPTSTPTMLPTDAPTQHPTEAPTPSPTKAPTNNPSRPPTFAPSLAPTEAPTHAPTSPPTLAPTVAPTLNPTYAPTDSTESPTIAPTSHPTTITASPTNAPTFSPSLSPTTNPTLSWFICRNDIECEYIAKIQFAIDWTATDAFGEFVSTLHEMSAIAMIITDVIETKLSDQILLGNMLVTTSLREDGTTVHTAADVATDDKNTMILLIHNIDESDDMVHTMKPKIVEAMRTQYSDSSFEVSSMEVNIQLINPETMESGDDHMENEKQQDDVIFKIIGGVLLVILFLLCAVCGYKKTNDKLSKNPAIWMPSSPRNANREYVHEHSDNDDDDDDIYKDHGNANAKSKGIAEMVPYYNVFEHNVNAPYDGYGNRQEDLNI
eukprot:221364_1